MEMIDLAMKWLVAPIGAFVFMMWNKQQVHHTEIEVLKSKADGDRLAHDREMKEMRETVRAIFSKLDKIEEALRK
jgi:hypothetical protein|tara:strand:- start:333 stop:557 length:225 start_codon:yes stop_codon:yes gene_type:complete